jgi:hypothetical protein
MNFKSPEKPQEQEILLRFENLINSSPKGKAPWRGRGMNEKRKIINCRAFEASAKIIFPNAAAFFFLLCAKLKHISSERASFDTFVCFVFPCCRFADQKQRIRQRGKRKFLIN